MALGLSLFLGACRGTSTPGPVSSPEPPRVTPTRQALLPTQTPQSTPVPVSSLEIGGDALQGVKIRFWHPWTGAAGAALRASVEAFNATNEFGVTVSETSYDNFNQLYENIELAFSEGSPPELAVGYNYQLLAWEEALVDLDPYVEDVDWGLSPGEQQDFFPEFWEQDVIEGRRLAFPAQRTAQLLVYNLTWARELGFRSTPASPQEFKEQACVAAQANLADSDLENDGAGGWVVNTTPSGLLAWIYAFGGQVVSPSGTGYRFHTPETAAALAFLKDLYDSGCAWKVQKSDASEGFMEGEHVETEFAGRRALFMTGSLADLPFQAAALEQAGNADEWTVIAFPSPDGEPVINTYGPSFAIFQSSPEAQLAAWLLVRWFTSPEEGARLAAASATFPMRAAAVEALGEYAALHPQWAAALELIPYARSEPPYASWSVVRWVVGDVGTQIFRSYFTPDRLPATLELMDETAGELHSRFR